MTTHATLLEMSSSGRMRPFDVSRDLNLVADLIEHCFSDSLGEDGQRYLRQMRAAARNPRFLRWAASVSDYVSLPLSGYVWEEAGQLVGNLSLIPFNSPRGRIYLIANVAVHPAYRRRGIARALAEQALDLARRRRKIHHVWLHVRADNQPAIDLYRSLGFRERTSRTAWRRAGSTHTDPATSTPGVIVQPRRARQWVTQYAWLKRLYPPALSWNMPLNIPAMRPGLQGGLYRLLTGTSLRQWAAVKDQRLIGVLSWQRYHHQPDQIWLAAPEGGEDLAARALLGAGQPTLTSRRSLLLDFPADRATEALHAVGFSPKQTLIWMETAVE